MRNVVSVIGWGRFQADGCIALISLLKKPSTIKCAMTGFTWEKHCHYILLKLGSLHLNLHLDLRIAQNELPLELRVNG